MLEESKRELDEARKSGLPVMVGEWSAALPIFDKTITAEGSLALERVYVAEQLRLMEDCPAWFFQTWKTAGHLSDWDARLALASFERDMLD